MNRRALLVAAVVPFAALLVITIVRALLGDGGDPRRTAHLDASARLLPARYVALPAPLPTDATLPEVDTCVAALAWMLGQGGSVAETGRFEVALTTGQGTQVVLERITARVVADEPVQADGAIAYCGHTDYREVHEPPPGDPGNPERFLFAGASHRVPALALPVAATAGTKLDLELADTFGERRTILLKPSEPLRVPFYLTRIAGPTHRVGITIEVTVSVGGTRRTWTLDDGGKPFWIYREAGPVARYDWLADTRRWVRDRPPYDPSTAAPSPDPATRMCRALTRDEISRYTGGVHEITGTDETCSWRFGLQGRLLLSSTTQPSVDEARAEMAYAARVRGGDPTRVDGVADELLVADRGLSARRGTELFELEVSGHAVDRALSRDEMVALARLAVSRLW